MFAEILAARPTSDKGNDQKFQALGLFQLTLDGIDSDFDKERRKNTHQDHEDLGENGNPIDEVVASREGMAHTNKFFHVDEAFCSGEESLSKIDYLFNLNGMATLTIFLIDETY